MNEKTVPLFSHSEAFPIIEEAIRIQTYYHLPERWDEQKSFCLLGDSVGPLANYQVLHLLEAAVSRLTDNLAHVPSPQDFYVHSTIHHLYRAATDRLFKQRIESQRGDKLEALLTRLFNRNFPHKHVLDFAAMSADHWLLMIDVGQVLLEREFPTGLRQGSLQNVPATDYSNPHNWLSDIWQKLGPARETVEPLACR